MVIYPRANTGEPHAAESPAPKMADGQVVVGDIPAPRQGLKPRPALLTQLNRASQGLPLVLTGTSGVGKSQLAATYARARLVDGWRLVAWIERQQSECP